MAAQIAGRVGDAPVENLLEAVDTKISGLLESEIYEYAEVMWAQALKSLWHT